MTRRDALSRVGARLSRPKRPARDAEVQGRPPRHRDRPEVGVSTRARQAAVVGTASLIALAPLAVGAPASTPTPPPQTGVPRPVAQPGAVGVDILSGRVGAETPATLPWTALPRLMETAPATVQSSTPATAPLPTTGIPATVAAAYRQAEAGVARTQPGCHLSWWVLAGIGYVESGHAAGGQVDAAGRVTTPIFGPLLDGSTPQTATVRDTDRGVLDGDSVHDRAVGPMQFLPSTWRGFGADGNGDGTADPQNVHDAALSAGRYLCAGGGDLRDASALHAAILRYNPSEQYVANVLAAGGAYRDGATPPPVAVPPADTGGTSPLPIPLPRPVAPRDSGTPVTPTPRRATPTPTPTPSATATPAPAPTTPKPSNTTPPTTPTPTPTATATPKPTTTTTPPTTPKPTSTTSPSPSSTATPKPTPSSPTSTTTSPSPTSTSPSPSEKPTDNPTAELPMCTFPKDGIDPDDFDAEAPLKDPRWNHVIEDGKEIPAPTPTCTVPED